MMPGRSPVRLPLGLRSRVAVGFGVVALGLSVLLSLTTWFLVTRYLDHQRRDAATIEITDNATTLQQRLDEERVSPQRAVEGLPTVDRVGAALEYRRHWYVSGVPRPLVSAIPVKVETAASGGRTASALTTLEGRPVLAIGVPLRRPGDAYFELFPLTGLHTAYRDLAVTLVLASLLSGGLGLLWGRVTSRQALKPLTELTGASAAFAAGDLGARMDLRRDPDLAELAQSFNQTAAALQERVAADARFAGDVSHELRTPLTTMLNVMQVLQNRRDVLPADLQEPMDMLAVELERFRRLVVDLIEMARESDGAATTREAVLICELVRRAADAATGRPVTVVDQQAEQLVLTIDKLRLERVVVNLVENAEVHGGGCERVSVRLVGGGVEILVEDRGKGVPPELRERIFERFARSDPGDALGVGLGLAIVARHVHAHHGLVEVRDRPDGGACFVVTLPRRVPQG